MSERIGLETVLEDANFMAGLKRYISGVSQMEGATDSAASKITGAYKSLGSTVLNIASTMAKAAVGGATALAAGLGAAAVTGLKFNSSLEIVEAQLNAFLKDGDAVAKTLDMIRDRASRTPFQFQEMANAAAALIPAAKQSGTELEKLISFAEILAASNPAQGLEGAAFSLKEALGGDFVSIVERFNLPRQMLNDLKKEGVPALEAVSMAMQSLGLDATLVTNLSQTAVGRLSTIKDNLLNIVSSITQPVFDVISNSMGDLITRMDAAKPAIDAVTGAIAGFIENVISGKDIVQSFQSALITAMMGLGFSKTEALETALEFGKFAEKVKEVYDRVVEFAGVVATFAKEHAPALRGALAGIAVLLGSSAITTALIGVGAALLSLLSPITLLIALAAGLGAAWNTNWGNIQGITQDVVGGIKSLLSGDGAGAMALFRSAWEEAWGGISTAVSNAWTSTIQPALTTLWTNVSNWFTSQNWSQLASTILASLNDVWNQISTAVGNAWTSTIQPSLTTLWTNVSTWFTSQNWKQIASSILTSLNDVWNQISTAVSNAWTSTIQPSLMTLWTNISNWFTSQNWGQLLTDAALQIGSFFGVDLQPFLTKLDEVTTYISNLATTVGDFLTTHANPLLSTIGGITGAFAGWAIVPTVTSWIASLSAGGAVLAPIVSGLGTVFTSLGAFGLTPILALFDTLAGMVGIRLMPTLSTLGQLLTGGLSLGFKTFWGIASGLVMPVLSSLGGLFGSLTGFISPVVSIIVSPLRGALAGLVGSLGGVNSMLGTVVTLLGGPVSAVLIALGALIGFVAVAWIRDWGNIREIVANAWEAIKAAVDSAISVIRPAFDTFMAGLKEGFASFAPLGEQFKQLWIAIEPIVTTVVGIIGAALAGLLAIVVGVFNGIANAIGPFLTLISGIVSTVIGIFTGLANFVTGFVHTIVSLFTGDLQGAVDGVRQMGSAIWQIFSSSWNGIISLIQNAVTTILSLVGGFVSGVVQFATNLYNILIGHSIFPDLIKGIIQLFIQLVSMVTAPLAQFVTKIVTGFLTLGTKVLAALTTLWTAIRGWFTSQPWGALVETVLIPKLVDPLKTLWTKAKEKIANLYNDFKAFITGKDWGAIGRAVVDGIKNGLGAAIGGLASKAAEMARAAIDAAKSALGISSPSTVFTGFGMNVGQGLINGVVSTYGAIRTAGQGMASALGGSPSGASPFGGEFAETLDQLISTVRDIAERFGSEVIKNVSDLADAGKKMVDLVQPFIEAINYLSTAKFGVNKTIIFAWGANLENVFDRISEVAWHFGSIDNGNLFSKVSSFADTMEKVSVLITQSLTTFGELVGFRELPGLEVGVINFANSIKTIVTAFGNTAVMFSRDFILHLAFFAKTTEPVYGLVQKAVEGIKALEGFKVGDVIPQMVLLDLNIRALIMLMGNTARTFEAEFLTQLQAFAQTAGAVTGIVQGSIDSLKALEGFSVGNLITPMATLDFNIRNLVGLMGNTARMFEAEFLTHLQSFAQTVGAVNGIVKPTIETIAEIAKFIPASGLQQKVSEFSSQLYLIVTTISLALSSASDEVRRQIESAASMMASITTVLGVVKLGLEALAGIATFVSFRALSIQAEMFAVQLVALAVAISDSIVDAGNLFKKQVAAAAELVASITAVLGLVKLGLEVLEGLGSYTSSRGVWANIQTFAMQLVQVAIALSDAIVGAGREFKKQLSQAVNFTDDIKTLLGIVKTAVDALAAIATYIPISDLTKTLTSFVGQLVATATALAMGLSSFSKKIQEQMAVGAELSKNVKEVLSIVKTAIDALAAISKYVAVENLEAQLVSFVDQMVQTIVALAAGLSLFNLKVIAQLETAAMISKNVKDVLAVVKTAVDALAAISKYVAVDNLDAQLASFVTQLVAAVISLTAGFNSGLAGLEEALLTAGNLSGLVKDVLDTVKRGVDSLKAISEYVVVGDLQARLSSFTSQLVQTVIALKNELVSGLAGMESSLETAGFLSELSKAVLDTVKRGVDSLKALGEYEAVTGLEAKLTDFTRQLVASVLALKDELIRGLMGMETALETAGNLSGLANSVLESVKRGVDALKALGEYEAIADLDSKLTSFASQFTAAVKTVADTMNLIPSILTAGTIEQANAISTAVSSVIGSVKNSISALNDLANGDSPQSLQGIMDKLVNALKIRIPVMDVLGFDFGAAFVTGLNTGIGTLSPSTIVAMLLSILLDALNSVVGDTQLYQGSWNIGQRIAQGIADGINDNRDVVQGSILGLTDSLVKLAEVNLGIASPSKVFTGIGMNVGAGMGVGIMNSMRGVSDLMTRNISTLMAPPPSRVYGGGSSSPRVQRPVIVQVDGGGTSNTLNMNTQNADASSVTRGYNWLQTMSRR